jgi:hypothetical protein
VEAQRTNRPDNGTDNVDSPMDGPGQVHGSYPGRVLRHSAFTRLVGRRIRPGEVLTAALSKLRRARKDSSRARSVASAGQAPSRAGAATN